MEATVKKDIEVTLKLSGEEAILLKDFVQELTHNHFQDILDGYPEEVFKGTVKMTERLWDVLNQLDLD